MLTGSLIVVSGKYSAPPTCGLILSSEVVNFQVCARQCGQRSGRTAC